LKAVGGLRPYANFVIRHCKNTSEPRRLSGLMTLGVKVVCLDAAVRLNDGQRGMPGVTAMIYNRCIQSERIELIDRVVADVAVEIDSTEFPDGVSVWPPPKARAVISVARYCTSESLYRVWTSLATARTPLHLR